ncbi:MAG: hypothetical protein ACI9OJ_004129 [Myxococcota bacterium]
MLAVRWYLRYGLSYSDVEELLAERGIDVDHVAIHRWVQRFTPLLIDAARPCRHSVGDRWFVDDVLRVDTETNEIVASTDLPAGWGISGLSVGLTTAWTSTSNRIARFDF